MMLQRSVPVFLLAIFYLIEQQVIKHKEEEMEKLGFTVFKLGKALHINRTD